MDNIKFCAPCSFGIEGILSAELKRMGALAVEPQDGRVFFEGDLRLLVRANLSSRYAERIHICLGNFEAKTFEQLFEGVKTLEWEKWIGEDDIFPVKGWSLNSTLFSIPDCQAIIKKAVVERLKSKYNVSWFEETGSLFQIQFALFKNTATLFIDTSGEGLHKRGYRRDSLGAPIKETLAAAIADVARARFATNVYDPCCGSGTLLIEAAMTARKIAPGINRQFTAMGWDIIPKKMWDDEREALIAAEMHEREFHAYGSDIDNDVAKLVRANAKKAGVGEEVSVAIEDLKNFNPETETGLVLCNPPYGERLLDVRDAERLYREMGRVFKQKPGWSYYIISPHEDFENLFGSKAKKRRKLYNGPIKCQLYMYY